MSAISKLSALLLALSLALFAIGCGEEEATGDNDYINETVVYTYSAELNGYIVGVGLETMSADEFGALTYKERYERLGVYSGTSDEISIPSEHSGEQGTHPVVAVGAYAFYGCGAFSVTLPETVTELGAYAFAQSSISILNIGSDSAAATLTAMGDGCFSGASCLRALVLRGSGNAPTLPEQSGLSTYPTVCVAADRVNLFKADESWSDLENYIVPLSALKGEYILSSGKYYRYIGKASSVTLPTGITELMPHAFENNRTLTAFTANKELTVIGNNAFYNCKALSSVTLAVKDGSLTDIGASAFKNCTSLVTFTIPNGILLLNNHLFSNCEKLNVLVIERGSVLNAIYPNAFFGCKMLATVTYEGSETLWNDIEIMPEGNSCLLSARKTFEEVNS